MRKPSIGVVCEDLVSTHIITILKASVKCLISLDPPSLVPRCQSSASEQG